MNKNKKKIVAIATATTGSACLLLAGAFALFTDGTASFVTAEAGTVEVDLSKPTMQNSTNINPGDNDPAISKTASQGTEHDLSFDVSNEGTKSIKTRHTLILSVNPRKNDGVTDLTRVLDARYVSLFSREDDTKELVAKTYVLDDDTEVASLDSAGDKLVKAIKYVYLSDSFDGKGLAIEDGGKAEKETDPNVVEENEVGEVTKNYTYQFALLKGADNEYQGATFNVDVIIEAMQYRNTETADWTTITKVKRTYTNATNTTEIPHANEKSDGTEY